MPITVVLVCDTTTLCYCISDLVQIGAVVDFDNARPIWLQLVDEFRRRIAVGDWVLGAKMPSVRDLALDLGVNPNTVQRALAELDRLGLAASERTAGRFVTDDPVLVGQIRDELAISATQQHITRLRGLGVSLGEATGLLQRHWNHDKEESDEHR